MDSLTRTDRIKKIADLNDAFRTSLAGGRVVVTSGVAALGHRTQVERPPRGSSLHRLHAR